MVHFYNTRRANISAKCYDLDLLLKSHQIKSEQRYLLFDSLHHKATELYTNSFLNKAWADSPNAAWHEEKVLALAYFSK